MLLSLFPLCRFTDSKVHRKIIIILKSMFFGPWTTWSEVDPDSVTAMWERFKVCTHYCNIRAINCLKVFFVI